MFQLQLVFECQYGFLYNYTNTTLPTLGIQVGSKSFQKYANNGIAQIKEYIDKAQIPQVNFNALEFKFQLNDIHVSDIDIQDIKINLPDIDQSAILNIDQLTLKFQFNMQETIYPYLQDQGSGILNIMGIQIIIYANPFISQPDGECRNYQYLNPNFTNQSSIYIDQFKVQFDSEYSYLYNGLLELFQQPIQDMLNEQIAPELLKSGLQQAIYGISDGLCVSAISGLNSTYGTGYLYQYYGVKNEILTVKLNGQYINQTYFSDGQHLYFDSVNDTNLQMTILTNDDFHYYIEKHNFQTGINHSLVEELNMNITCIKYVNQGVLMAYGKSVYLIKLLEQNNINNENQISIISSIDSFYGCYNQTTKQIIYQGDTYQGQDSCKLQDYQLKIIEDFYQINYFNTWNSYGMSIDYHCNILYQDDDNIHMGCKQQ